MSRDVMRKLFTFASNSIKQSSRRRQSAARTRHRLLPELGSVRLEDRTLLSALILFNPTGGATIGGFNPGTSEIASLNFGAGDAVAVGAVPLVPGSTFQLYYQTQLVALNGPNGAPLPSTAYAGLGSAYQITEVASITEMVQSVSANGATAQFIQAPVQAPGSGVKIYFEDLTAPGAVRADANTGQGFNAGTVILTMDLTTGQATYTDTTINNGLPRQPLNGLPGGGYAGVTTDQGTGINTLSLGVESGYNSAFFATPGLVTSAFASNLRNNFADILASQAFNDPSSPVGSAPSIIPNVGANNGTSGPDFLIQVSGATESFEVQGVPSKISSNFNGTAIAADNTIWFNSVIDVSGLSTTHPVTIRLVNQEIKFAALGVNYDLRVPNSIITFSPSTTTATTTFDTTTQTWITNVPSSGLAGNVFLAGLGFKVPTGGLPGGINPVTWQGVFQTDPGVSLKWKWAAAVYDNTKAPTPFPSGPSVDYTPVGVKPVDDNQASPFKNADHAGTPEYYKPYVIGGARGGGGSNYTGSYSGSASVTSR